MTTHARQTAVLIPLMALAMLWGSGARADVTIDGFVKTEGGAPIFDADLDWYNRDLNLEIDPTGDHTNGSAAPA